MSTGRLSTERYVPPREAASELDLPQYVSQPRVSTLVGMPSVAPEVLQAAKEQRGLHLSPPSYDSLQIDLSAVGVLQEPRPGVHVTVPSPPGYEALRVALSPVPVAYRMPSDALRVTVPAPPGEAEVATALNPDSTADELLIDVDVDVAEAVRAQAIANRVTRPAPVLVEPAEAPAPVLAEPFEAPAPNLVEPVKIPRAPRLSEMSDSLAPAMVRAEQFAVQRRRSIKPWLLAAAVALLGVFAWAQRPAGSESAAVQAKPTASEPHTTQPVAAAQPPRQAEVELAAASQPVAHPSPLAAPLLAAVAHPAPEGAVNEVPPQAETQVRPRRTPRVESAIVRHRPSRARSAALAEENSRRGSSKQKSEEPESSAVADQEIAPPPAVVKPTLEMPRREDVQRAMAAVHGAVAQCVGDKSGQAQVTTRVANNGKVTHVLVNGDFAGTRVGSCIARAVRTATLPPFVRPQFEFSYPFAF